jgi:hypothetical protein
MPQLLQQYLLEFFVHHVGATPRKVKRPPRNETTASLSSLGRRPRARAYTRRAGTTTARAISSADALPTDKLLPIAVTDILISGGIERGPTLGSASLCGACRGLSRVRGWWGRATSEAAALLALLERSTWAGANACREGATTAGAVGVRETLSSDELFALAIANVRGPVGVKGWDGNNGGSEGDEGGNGDEDGLHDGDL